MPCRDMAHGIDKASVRASLKPRNEPYWGQRLDKGRQLGVRAQADGLRTWVAKARVDGRQHTKALGSDREHEYGEARKLADAWFAELDRGVTDVATVEEACREYVAALEADGRGARATGDRRKDPKAVAGWGAAHDSEMRFRRLVYGKPIGARPLDKIRTAELREWRNAVPGSKDSGNRNWECLRAALFLAVTNRRVPPWCAQEWRDVKKHKNAKQSRSVFLDVRQRRKLLAACGAGALRDLVEAAMTTGARPGELVNAKRSQFDARTKTMQFVGKVGPRSVPLSPPAVALFTRLAKGKLPAARLLVGPDGKPWSHSGYDETFKAAVKKAKLPPATVLYSCRHSAITAMLTAGMSTLDVCRIVGTSLAMLEKNYGHLAVSAARDRLADVELL